MLYSCPNFIVDLKTKKIISKTIWSIKYNNKYEGEFIIGNELFEYNPIKYPKSKYSTTYIKINLSISLNQYMSKTFGIIKMLKIRLIQTLR